MRWHDTSRDCKKLTKQLAGASVGPCQSNSIINNDRVARHFLPNRLLLSWHQ